MSRVIQVHSVPWNAPQQKTTSTNIFDKIKERTNDPDWKKIFEDASKGIFRTSFRYDGKYLIYSVKGRNKQNKMLVPEDPDEALEACQLFMRNMDGVRTKIENKSEKIINRKEDVDWNRLKKSENARLFHINRYGSRLADSMKLDQSRRLELIHRLRLLMNSSEFDNKRVIFENRHIKEVKDLQWEKNGRLIYIQPLKKDKISCEPVIYSDANDEGIDYQTNWSKYIKKLQRRWIDHPTQDSATPPSSDY